MNHRIGYLSGAPRVSTSEAAYAGGPRAHVLGVIQAFERMGWRVERFIVGDRLAPTAGRTAQEWARRGSFVTRAIGDIGKLAIGAVSARRALQELDRKVDWVYERFAAFQSLGLPFQRRGVPWILETQGPMFYEARTERRVSALSGLARQVELAAYNRCDVLVCVSDAVRDILAEHGVDPARMIVVPNGVDTEFFDPAKHAPMRLSSAFTIGFVGTLDNWQSLDVLLEAIAEIVRTDGADISVTVVGTGLMQESWIDQARRLGLETRVRFLGQRPRHEIPALIRGFDVGFSGQRRMSIGSMYHSPLKLLEYLSMGVPVIASDFADAKRVVTHGENGFLFSHERVGTLTMAIRAAIAARSRLPVMGQLARAEILRAHSWDARVSYMKDRINDLLPSAKRCH